MYAPKHCKTAKYYRDAAEEMLIISTFMTSQDCKNKLRTVSNDYLAMAKQLEDHEADVETSVQRALRRQARELAPE